MAEHVIDVTDASFEQEILQSTLPVLVDFWASWCAPCRMIGPVVEDVAGEYSGRLKVAKMNVDDNMNTPSRFGIRGIPALLFFKNGEVVEQVVGAVPRSQVVTLIEKVLG
jgi:thioredoxin 1